MDVFALVVALVAVALAAAAFSRTGGITMLEHRAEEARRLAANALGRVEELVRPHAEDRDAIPTPEGREGE